MGARIASSAMEAIAVCNRWTAHILEQYSSNKLIRPLAEYTGPRDLKYIPIEQRQSGS